MVEPGRFLLRTALFLLIKLVCLLSHVASVNMAQNNLCASCSVMESFGRLPCNEGNGLMAVKALILDYLHSHKLHPLHKAVFGPLPVCGYDVYQLDKKSVHSSAALQQTTEE